MVDSITQFRFRYLGYGLALFFLFLVLDLEFLALLSALGVVGVLYAFRDPEVELNRFEKGSVVAVSDGVVREITPLDDNSEYGTKVVVEGSYKDLSLLRVPFDAKVESFKIVHGSRLPADALVAKYLNENGEVVFVDDQGAKVAVTHQLKRSFAPLFFDLHLKKSKLQTSRYGVAFNATTTLYLPKGCEVDVSVGDVVHSGETQVAHFSR
jgi:hypothetical protein